MNDLSYDVAESKQSNQFFNSISDLVLQLLRFDRVSCCHGCLTPVLVRMIKKKYYDHLDICVRYNRGCSRFPSRCFISEDIFFSPSHPIVILNRDKKTDYDKSIFQFKSIFHDLLTGHKTAFLYI